MVLMRRQQADSASISVEYGDENMYGQPSAYDAGNTSFRRQRKPIQKQTSFPSSMQSKKSSSPLSFLPKPPQSSTNPQRHQSHPGFRSSSSSSSFRDDKYETLNPYSEIPNDVRAKTIDLKGSATNSKGLALILLNFLAISVLGYLSFKSSSQLKETTKEFKSLKIDFEDLTDLLEYTESELESAHEEFHGLQLSVLTGMGQKAKSDPSRMTSHDRAVIADNLLEKDDAQVMRIKTLQESIQRFHKIELERR